jgi:hypothetical protein
MLLYVVHSTRILVHEIDIRLRSTIAMAEVVGPVVTPAPSTGSGVFPALAQPRILHRAILAAAGEPGSMAQAPDRHQIGNLLGVGTTGEVFSVSDHNLERIIAIKIIPPEHSGDREAITHLIDEARITASLAHPNVLPVYDLDLDANGRAYFSMKRIEGRSLGDVIAQSSLSHRDPMIGSGNAIVTIFIGICQALAYAHRRGVVHQDIKPENIMLGEFGEVLVVDWGSAERLRPGVAPRLYGTPLYMSPEQARNESVDERSDVYCMGATLLHVLLQRLPVWHDDVDVFWSKKRNGTLDAITPDERRLAPPALLSIAAKALSALPHERYANAGEMLKDLQAYQAGLVVVAHHDSLWERLRRWHRRHGRQLWISLLFCGLLAALGTVLAVERAKERASWGEPKVVEDFTAPDVNDAWMTLNGAFARSHGALESTGTTENLIVFKRKFFGATAMEYDAVNLPGHPACDLSAVWCPDLVSDPKHPEVKTATTTYYFQLGANDGIYSLITASGKGWWDKEHLSYAPLRARIGQTYHVRVQIADNRLEMWVDGVLTCSWSQPFSFTSGYLGLYAYYEGKAFSHVRIFSRGIPQKVSATAIGDSYVQNGDTEEAANQYAWVASSNPGTAVGEEAIYKQGICRYQQDRRDEAFAIWQPLRATAYAPLIQLEDIDALYKRKQYQDVLSAMRAFCQHATNAHRQLLAMQWSHYTWDFSQKPDLDWLPKFMVFHDECLKGEIEEDSTAAHALFALKRYQEVLDQYPDQRVVCSEAMMEQRRYHDMYVTYPEQVFPRAFSSYFVGDSHDPFLARTGLFYGMSLWHEGEFQKAMIPSADFVAVQASILASQGKLEEALQLAPKTSYEHDCILANAGRWLEIEPTSTNRDLRLLMTGHAAELLSGAGVNGAQIHMAQNLLGLQDWIRGDHHFPKGFAKTTDYNQYTDFTNGTFYLFAMPLAQELAGERGALARSCQEAMTTHRWDNRQRYYYQASYLMGTIDDAAYLVHPWKLFAPAELWLLKGIRADLQGRSADAVAAYTAWNAIPYYQQDEYPNPAWHVFVEWRIQVLSGKPPEHVLMKPKP